MSQRVTEAPALASIHLTAGADKLICSGPGVLRGILVGADVSGGVIEVSDHATDGDGNVKIHMIDAPVGYYPVNMIFRAGCRADLTTQTHVTFMSDPAG